jgi:hypothetical protein
MMHVLKTLASYKEDPKEGEVVLIGFMAQHWDFLCQLRRLIPWPWACQSKQGNILYEIDGQPALDLYKKILRR